MIRNGKSVTYTFATYVRIHHGTCNNITGTNMCYITDEVFASKKPTEQCIRLLIHRIEFWIQMG